MKCPQRTKSISSVRVLERGIDALTALKVISEIGLDMTRWPTGKHFASWLGLCPGNKLSGGKRYRMRSKPTANRAASALRLAAQGLVNSHSALGAYYRRMRARLGAPKAMALIGFQGRNWPTFAQQLVFTGFPRGS